MNQSTRFGSEEPSGPRLNPSRRYVGVWLSLVERPVRDRKVAGSNPVAPTIKSSPPQPTEFRRQRIEERARDGAVPRQRLDFMPQRMISAAPVLEKPPALRRILLQDSVVQHLDPLPPCAVGAIVGVGRRFRRVKQ
jgi:hypothetical protein